MKNIKAAVTFCLSSLCALIIILPSGKIFYFNSKLILSIVLVLLLFKGRKEINLRGISRFVLCSFLFLIFISVSVAIGYVNGFSDTVLKELYMFLGFYVIFLVNYLAYKSKYLDKKVFLKTVLFSSFAFYAIKVLVYLLMCAHVLNAECLNGFILNVFDSGSMIGFVAKGLRINFVSDLFCVVVVVFLNDIVNICFDHRKTMFLWVYYLFAAFSVYLSYSRYIWFSFMLLMTVKFIFNFKDVSERKIFYTVIVFFVLFVSLFSSPHDRISGVLTHNSDKARVTQFDALEKQFVTHPLLGLGMGGYDKNCIRSSIAIYSYEMEIPAFLMKFGVIGFLNLCVILFFYLQKLYMRKSYFILFTFLVMLFYGFLNPYVIKSPFSLLMFMLYILSEHENHAAVAQKENIGRVIWD